jgi:hypothetical protein
MACRFTGHHQLVVWSCPPTAGHDGTLARPALRPGANPGWAMCQGTQCGLWQGSSDITKRLAMCVRQPDYVARVMSNVTRRADCQQPRHSPAQMMLARVARQRCLCRAIGCSRSRCQPAGDVLRCGCRAAGRHQPSRCDLERHDIGVARNEFPYGLHNGRKPHTKKPPTREHRGLG